MIAFDTLDIFCGKSVKLMCLLYIRFIQVFDIIVAEPACEEFLALFAPLLACPLIVLAPVFHDNIWFPLGVKYFSNLILLLLLLLTLLLLTLFFFFGLIYFLFTILCILPIFFFFSFLILLMIFLSIILLLLVFIFFTVLVLILIIHRPF